MSESQDTIAAEELTYLSLEEFIDMGFLQEINRCLLHPAGLALALGADELDPTVGIVRVWDCRDDPEGVVYQDGILDCEKFNRVAEEMSKHTRHRMKMFNQTHPIQTLPYGG